MRHVKFLGVVIAETLAFSFLLSLADPTTLTKESQFIIYLVFMIPTVVATRLIMEGLEEKTKKKKET